MFNSNSRPPLGKLAPRKRRRLPLPTAVSIHPARLWSPPLMSLLREVVNRFINSKKNVSAAVAVVDVACNTQSQIMFARPPPRLPHQQPRLAERFPQAPLAPTASYIQPHRFAAFQRNTHHHPYAQSRPTTPYKGPIVPYPCATAVPPLHACSISPVCFAHRSTLPRFNNHSSCGPSI